MIDFAFSVSIPKHSHVIQKEDHAMLRGAVRKKYIKVIFQPFRIQITKSLV